MSAVCGLDLSLVSTGVAVLETAPPYVREYGECVPALLRSVGEAGKKTDSYVQRNRRIRTQTRAITALLADFQIMLAVIESPVYSQPGGSAKLYGNPVDTGTLFHSIIAWLDVRNVPIAFIPPTTGHQFVTGKGLLRLPNGEPDRKKQTVIDETRKWWPAGRRDVTGQPPIPRVHNGDEGDALGLAVMGALHEGLTLPFRPGARHYNAIAKCVWPTPGRRP